MRTLQVGALLGFIIGGLLGFFLGSLVTDGESSSVIRLVAVICAGQGAVLGTVVNATRMILAAIHHRNLVG